MNNHVPDGEDQNQEFQVYEKRPHCLVVQLFRDKPPADVIAVRSTIPECTEVLAFRKNQHMVTMKFRPLL